MIDESYILSERTVQRFPNWTRIRWRYTCMSDEELNRINRETYNVRMIRKKKLKSRTRLTKNVTDNSQCSKCYKYEKFRNELKKSLSTFKEKIFSRTKDFIHIRAKRSSLESYIKTWRWRRKTIKYQMKNEQPFCVNTIRDVQFSSFIILLAFDSKPL